MIIGEYPCCDEPLTLSVPDRTPAFRREDCPHCGARVWHRLSRLDPESWTEEAFLEIYQVDEVTKAISLRNPPPEPTAAEKAIADMLAERIAADYRQAMMDILLYGRTTMEIPGA